MELWSLLKFGVVCGVCEGWWSRVGLMELCGVCVVCHISRNGKGLWSYGVCGVYGVCYSLVGGGAWSLWGWWCVRVPKNLNNLVN